MGVRIDRHAQASQADRSFPCQAGWGSFAGESVLSSVRDLRGSSLGTSPPTGGEEGIMAQGPGLTGACVETRKKHHSFVCSGWLGSEGWL